MELNEKKIVLINAIESFLCKNPYEIKRDLISTGFKNLDRGNCYLDQNELLYIGAKTGMGKTAFMIDLAINISQQDLNVAYFSLDEKIRNLVNKLVTKISGAPYYQSNTKKINNDDLGDLSNLQFYDMYDSCKHVITKCSMLNAKDKLDVVFIDDVHFLSNAIDPQKEEDFDTIIHKLAVFSKKIDKPIVVSSNLRSSAELKDKKEAPDLTDLPKSIEDFANKIILLHRPYDDTSSKVKSNEAEKDLCEVIISKNDNGICSKQKLRYIKTQYSFMDW